MISRGSLVAGGLLAASIIAGTIADKPRPSVARDVGEYRVLTADFHVHSLPFSWSTLAPWDAVTDARYSGLDVVALTPHNDTWVAELGLRFSDAFNDPMVIIGEEITTPRYHLLAIGIEDTISPYRYASPAGAIREIHAQGGVAIAAHPYPSYWPAYDQESLALLDGAEIVRPETIFNAKAAAELQGFSRRGTFAAIGSTDYHGMGPVGFCRTYIFARGRSEQAVIDAIREKHTVAFDRVRFYGEPEFVELATEAGLPRTIPDLPAPGLLRWFSRVAAVLGMAAGVLVGGRRT